MNRKFLLFVVALALVVFPTFAYGEEDIQVDASVDTRPSTDIRSLKPLPPLDAARRDAKKAEMEAKRDEMRDNAEANREEKRDTMEAKRTEMQDKREMMASTTQAKRDEIQAKRAEFRQDIAKRRVENTSKVVSATIERLEKIIVRIESRLTKIKENGGDTSESERYVASAKANLDAAKSGVSAFTSIELTSDKAQDNFERIRTAVKEVKDQIKSAHENLTKAVSSMKGSGGNTTSTDENSQ